MVSATRMEHISEALQISEIYVINTKAEADEVEVRSSYLASQVISLKEVINETKQTCTVIQNEHNEIA